MTDDWLGELWWSEDDKCSRKKVRAPQYREWGSVWKD